MEFLQFIEAVDRDPWLKYLLISQAISLCMVLDGVSKRGFKDGSTWRAAILCLPFFNVIMIAGIILTIFSAISGKQIIIGKDRKKKNPIRDFSDHDDYQR